VVDESSIVAPVGSIVKVVKRVVGLPLTVNGIARMVVIGTTAGFVSMVVLESEVAVGVLADVL
jgi:hypothetical protein